jgi:hypothetical protein
MDKQIRPPEEIACTRKHHAASTLKGRAVGLEVTKKEVSIQENTADMATKHFRFSAKLSLIIYISKAIETKIFKLELF